MMGDVQTIGDIAERRAGDSAALPSGFDRTSWWKAMAVTESPVVPLPPGELVDRLIATAAGRAELVGVLQRREELIGAMKEDPLHFGWKPWFWKRADGLLAAANELVVMGGNRSTKTEWAADGTVRKLVEGPKRITAFCHSSADSSKRLQQPRIYQYLPPEWRQARKSKSVYVSYTAKNGFADGVFILPNGSQGYFFNYMQDVRVLEGYEFDDAWLDELAPVDWIEAMRYRLVTRKGTLRLTFTPVEGYTPAVGKYVAGARVLETRASPLLSEKVNVKDCPKGTMPFVLRCASANAHVIYFFTEWNLFNPYEEMVKKLAGAQLRDVMMRAYGWVEKAGGVAFPKFSAVHVVKRAEFGGVESVEEVASGELGVKSGEPESSPLVTGHSPLGFLVPPRPWENLYKGRLPWRGTNYRVADPAPLKNWVIKWYRCDELGRVFLYREWPDWGSHGAWAIAGNKADGDLGPAQRAGFGKGIRDYKRIILEAEGWIWKEVGSGEGRVASGRWEPGPGGGEVIMGSVMDPRGGGAAVPSDVKATSILELLNEAQVDEGGNIVGPGLEFREARGLRVGEGMDQFREWLTYDEQRPVDALNCPRFYVVEDCEQSIFCYREYTGLDGEKGMLKDVFDPDRYFRTTPGLGFVGENDLGSIGGGGY